MPSSILADVPQEAADRWPSNIAVVTPDERVTYAELQNAVRTFARGLLSLGVREGDRVGVLTLNRLEWFVANYAVQMVGATFVGLDTWYKREELEYALSKTDASTFITMASIGENQFLNSIEEIAPGIEAAEPGEIDTPELPFLQQVVTLDDPRSWTYSWNDVVERGETVSDARLDNATESVTPESIAYILFTSGTTGRPKPVVLDQDTVVTNAEAIGARMGWTPEDRLWFPLPLNFSFGACNGGVTPLLYGGTVIIQPGFDPVDGLETIEAEAATLMYAMEDLLRRLESADRDLTEKLESVRGCMSSGPTKLFERYETEYDVPMMPSYGLTENSSLCTVTAPDDHRDDKLEYHGQPLPATDVRVKDPETGAELSFGELGEIRVRSRATTQCYYKRPTLTRDLFDEEGFIETGDMGWLAPDGRVVFEGRAKDMIKTGGINVSPLEVKDLLESHDSVDEAAVFGVPGDEKKEVVGAAVRPAENQSVDEDALQEYCRERIAEYKVPQLIHIQEGDFPRTESRKVITQEVRESVIERYSE